MQSNCIMPQRLGCPPAPKIRRVVGSSRVGDLSSDPIVDSDDEHLVDAEETAASGPVELVSNVGGQIHDDDPHIDWRTQAQLEVETTDPDDDDSDGGSSRLSETPSPSPVVGIDLEPVASQVQAVVAPPGLDRDISERYSAYLETLCSFIQIRDWSARPLECLRVANAAAGGFSLDIDWSSDNVLEHLQASELVGVDSANDVLDLYAHGLVICVWLSISMAISFNDPVEAPVQAETCDRSYFQCAHAALPPGRDFRWQDLRWATAMWEGRLRQQGSWNDWLKSSKHCLDPSLHVDPVADVYMQALVEEGRAGLAMAIIKMEHKGEKTPVRGVMRNPMLKASMLQELLYILAFVDQDLLKAVIEGRVFQQRAVRDHPVREALNRLEDVDDQPSIYINGIANHIGISPTPKQWSRVCKHIKLYLEDSPEAQRLAAIVDQVIFPVKSWPSSKARDGFRRYTDWNASGSQWQSVVHPARRQMVHYFVSEMESRIDSERQAGREGIPFGAPVVEVGYSLDSTKRLKEHRRHRSSNYLMNLAEAMFQYLYPGVFPLQQAIIYACYRPLQPWLAEIVFTQVAQAYTSGGRGFSHYPAGYSNSSAYIQTPTESWTRYFQEACENSDLEEHMNQISLETAAITRSAEQQQQEQQDEQNAKAARLKALAELLDSMTALRKQQMLEREQNAQRED